MGNVDSLRAQRILSRLRVLAAELSGHDPADLVETSTFLDLGFDSLFLTQLASVFQAEYGLKITFRQLFNELPSLRAMADYIDRTLPPESSVEVSPPDGAVATVTDKAAPGVALNPALPALPAPEAGSSPQQAAATARPAQHGSAGAAGSSLQSVMAQQLVLMSQQIQLLQSLQGGANAATPMPRVPPRLASATDLPASPAVAEAAATTVTEAGLVPPPSPPPGGSGPQSGPEVRALTPRQRAHIQRLTLRYNARTSRSKQLTQEHRPHHADPRTAAGFNRLWKEMVYPIVIERSSGCHLQDVDGNEYIDILNGFGPNFLGHSPPFVSDALKAQIDRGIEVGPQTPLAGEAARLFCEITGMDRVSWVNTGSEAVQAAIRLARTYTGRNRIVVFSGDYHGNFDEVLVRVTRSATGRRTLPLAPGIPFRAVEDVLVLDYGSDESLDIIAKHAGEIAAVLVEPVQSRRPELQPREFLHALRKLTEDEGILLVFDEVITGFRICPGGAQEHFGIKADLATYGKIIGGGMPIGVVAGRARFMDTFDGGQWQYGDDSFPAAGVTFFAGTFVRHPLAVAAVHATLQYLKAQGPALQETVNRRTTRMVDALNRFFVERGVKIHIPHFASQMFIRVQEEGELATLLFFHLRDRGIHVLENFPSYMTAAHTDADVERIIAAFKDSVLEMQADAILPAPPLGQDADPWVRRLPLTDGQREIWFASQMDELASCAFNESDTVRIEGPLDSDRFVAAAAAALGEQEAFRYRFDPEGAFQWVDQQAMFEVPLVDLTGATDAQRSTAVEDMFKRESMRAFDLEQGPLVRAALVRLGVESHVFVVYCHHIVFDGYSAEILMRRIAERYGATDAGSECGEEPVPYSVYALGTTTGQHSRLAQRALEYWRGAYAVLPETLELPTDRPRESFRSFRGATHHRQLDAALTKALRETATALRTSMNVLLLCSYQSLLARLSGQEDVVVGVPVAGQARTRLDAVGCCVNLLPMRGAPEHSKAFSRLVVETQANLFDALEHQEASLGQIVNALAMPRDSSRLPLVEVVFNYSRYFSSLQIPGCDVTTHENPRHAIYFDMFFNVIESEGQLVIDWDYNRDLFDEQTIARWTDHFTELLKDIVADRDRTIGELELMSRGEREATVSAWAGQ